MLLFPNKNAGYNFIHNDCNLFSLIIKNKSTLSKGKKVENFGKKEGSIVLILSYTNLTSNPICEK